MKDLIDCLTFEDALIITAPPGWGKTYKLLDGIKNSNRKVLFIFPLRALCDEVEISAQNMSIDVLNIRSNKDLKVLNSKKFQLVVSTPELLENGSELFQDYLIVLDEFHLFYYWGDSFRERMLSMYFEFTSFGLPIIFLTATLSNELKLRLEKELEFNYENIHHLNMGNQKLKNLPSNLLFYPRFLKKWLRDDFMFSKKVGISLVFCQYREEVKQCEKQLKKLGHTVLSCIGGEASDFVNKLNHTENIDFIVATSVVSHGVNLPNISKVYFTFDVKNIDFYLQMVGRGGRAGEKFELHTFNNNYFSKNQLLYGFLCILIKRLRNKINSLIYYAHES